MCGICGVYGLNDEKLIQDMNDKLIHRGPDGEGTYIDKNIMLGHRRLSIIDLKSGQQPIHNEDESVWISYNGEIYNFLELREKLEANGHHFYTSTDTEVIVHLYEEMGERCVEKLNGEFSFAIWDQNKKQLMIARDRLGVKPLYYLYRDNIFLFASEIKSILEYKEYKPEVDSNSLHNFLVFRYNNSLQTLFKDIKKVPPGHYMLVKDNNFTINSYWEIIIDDSMQKSKTEYAKDLLKLLEDSVERRLISDVPLGAYLSGGIDSSSVVSMMSLFMNEPKTFSVGFGEYGESELEYARLIAEHFGTNHHEIIVEPNAMELLPKIIWHLDEPMADLATIPVYLMSQEAKKEVSVVLTGDGNDEIWAGYPKYKLHMRLKKLRGTLPKFVRTHAVPAGITCLPNSHLKSWLNNKKYVLVDDETCYNEIEGVFLEKEKQEMYSDLFVKKLNPIPTRKQVHSEYFKKQCGFLNQMLLIDTMTLLPNSYLVKTDRMTMAHGVEVRVPLIDYRIVEYAYSVPENLKLNGDSEKYLFKQALKRSLPKEILERKKRGFSVPFGEWIKDLEGLPQNIFESREFKNRGYFKPEFLEKVAKSVKNPSHRNSQRMWSLIAFEIWHRIFIDQVGEPDIKL